jgi:hypothetical protein
MEGIIWLFLTLTVGVGSSRCPAGGSPPAIWNRFTASLLDLPDADVVAAGFPHSVAYASGRVAVSSLRCSNK